MRRKDKKIVDKAEIEKIIKESRSCRMVMCSNNIPYIVPVYFGYDDDIIYIHSAKKGKKIDIIKRNGKVYLQIDSESQTIPSEKACKWHSRYKSVIAFANAEIVQSYAEKVKALSIIMKHYTSKNFGEFDIKEIEKIAIIKIKLETITGKISN
ncbi:MAG: pyridoxamine 5'-phosphate oxidase family protein [Promethearchaeota archaeon]